MEKYNTEDIEPQRTLNLNYTRAYERVQWYFINLIGLKFGIIILGKVLILYIPLKYRWKYYFVCFIFYISGLIMCEFKFENLFQAEGRTFRNSSF